MAYVRDRCCRRPPRRPCRPVRDRAAGGPRRRGRRRSRRPVNQPSCSTAPSPGWRVVDRALQGVAGVLALAGHADLDAAISARLDGLDAAVARARGRHRDRVDDDELVDGVEELNAALVAARDVLWALRHDRLRTARAVADLAGPRCPAVGAGRLHGRPGGAVGARPAGGAGPGLGRAAPAGLGPRARPGERRGGPAAGRPGRRRPLRLGRGPGGRREPGLRLQGRRRDRRAGRQHRGAARRHPRRRAAPPRARVAVGPRDRAGPHPLGQRRHHLRAQRPPGQPRGGGRVAGAVRGRRAERRRRQPRRPQGPLRPAHPGRRSPPTPRSSRRSSRARPAARPTSPRPSGAPWPRSRDRWPSAPSWPASPTRSGWRSGGAARALYVGPGRGRVRRGQRAVRPGGGDRPLRAHRRRDAVAGRPARQPRPGLRPRRRPRRAARGHPGAWPTTAPSSTSPRPT